MRPCYHEAICIFLHFNFRILAVDYIYYEAVVQIPKAVSHQNFYYNYSVMPSGAQNWQCFEFFYDHKETNFSAARQLVIPGNAGK